MCIYIWVWGYHIYICVCVILTYVIIDLPLGFSKRMRERPRMFQSCGISGKASGTLFSTISSARSSQPARHAGQQKQGLYALKTLTTTNPAHCSRHDPKHKPPCTKPLTTRGLSAPRWSNLAPESTRNFATTEASTKLGAEDFRSCEQMILQIKPATPMAVVVRAPHAQDLASQYLFAAGLHARTPGS